MVLQTMFFIRTSFELRDKRRQRQQIRADDLLRSGKWHARLLSFLSPLHISEPHVEPAPFIIFPDTSLV